MFKTFLIAAFAAASLAAGSAGADENSVRQAFQSKFPKMAVESVTRTPFPNVYEVVVDGQVFYTDEKTSYLFSGNLLDLRAGQPRNMTQETNNKLAAGLLAKSTEFAVKRVKGNGKRVVYTFEDPNCGYCKEQQKELGKMNDVTIYTFLWPILSQDSVDKAKAIWCSKDRARAWEDTMLRGATPSGRRDCDTTPLDRNAQIAQRFGLRGTPAVYVASGEQIGGFVPAEKIEAALRGK